MTVGILLTITVIFTKKRAQRIADQRQRWKDIKELEEDYDVYVSDEYAYHITDEKTNLNQLQNLDGEIEITGR